MASEYGDQVFCIKLTLVLSCDSLENKRVLSFLAAAALLFQVWRDQTLRLDGVWY